MDCGSTKWRGMIGLEENGSGAAARNYTMPFGRAPADEKIQRRQNQAITFVSEKQPGMVTLLLGRFSFLPDIW